MRVVSALARDRRVDARDAAPPGLVRLLPPRIDRAGKIPAGARGRRARAPPLLLATAGRDRGAIAAPLVGSQLIGGGGDDRGGVAQPLPATTSGPTNRGSTTPGIDAWDHDSGRVRVGFDDAGLGSTTGSGWVRRRVPAGGFDHGFGLGSGSTRVRDDGFGGSTTGSGGQGSTTGSGSGGFDDGFGRAGFDDGFRRVTGSTHGFDRLGSGSTTGSGGRVRPRAPAGSNSARAGSSSGSGRVRRLGSVRRRARAGFRSTRVRARVRDDRPRVPGPGPGSHDGLGRGSARRPARTTPPKPPVEPSGLDADDARAAGASAHDAGCAGRLVSGGWTASSAKAA